MKLRSRFSLRTMFVAMTVISVGLTLFAVPLYQGRVDRQAADLITDVGGNVVRVSTLSDLPDWVLALLPADYHVRAWRVSLIGLGEEPDYEAVGQLRHLTELDICAGNLKATDWQHLANLKELQKLRIRHSQIDTADMEALSSCVKLESVVFDSSELEGDNVGFLARLPNLKTLDLGSIRHGHIEIAESRSLECLTLASCDTLTLRNLSRLSTLDIWDISQRISASRVGKIEHLDLQCDEIELMDVPRLTSLQLTAPKRLTISDLPNLIEFQAIDGSEAFFETCFDALESLPSLKVLRTDKGIQEQDLKRLFRFPSLKELHLGRSRVTRAGVQFLADYPRPLSITMDFTAADDCFWQMSDNVSVLFDDTPPPSMR